MEELRFGIIGAGNIASSFAKGIETAKGAVLYAVGARKLENAKEFAKKYHAEKAYGSYEELVNDPMVDVIYVATPNSLHKAHSILAMRHHKHVICEKPLASNAKEVEEMIAVAKEEKVFFMEAMWTRYFPVIRQVKQLVNNGDIGKLQMIQADFGFCGISQANIRYDLNLSGGALMDVGIYPISFASFFMEEQPVSISAEATFCETGIDEANAVNFKYSNGALAVLSSAININTPRNAYLIGEHGYIHIPNVWQPTSYTIKQEGKNAEAYLMPYDGNGYQFEVEEVVACIKTGKKQSNSILWSESLSIMHTLDSVREKIGLKFPADSI